VAAEQPAAVEDRAHPARRRRRAGPLRRHVHRMGSEQFGLVGRGRGRSSTWTARSSRRSAGPARRTTSAAPGTSTSGRTAAVTPSSVRRTWGCRR
jgi:hypothetical protein